MKLEQSTLQRTFLVEYKGESYCINYLNSDGQVLGLINRDNWEIFYENGEEINIYTFQSDTKKQKEQIKQNRRLVRNLIGFCIRHFKDYQPDYN